MFPQRKLLYERGLDESVGTYATDYVITFQCALFILILLYLRYVKYGNSISKRNTYNKSFWAVMVVNFSVGIAALVGGLAHQFLGSVSTVACIPIGRFREVNGFLVAHINATGTSKRRQLEETFFNV